MYRCTREEIEKAPTCGGIYLFYSAGLDLLYIGKTRNLRHRIKQHLFPRGTSGGSRAIVGWFREFWEALNG